jgi:hypothetical protein
MENNISIFNCNLIYLPKIENRAGNITPIHKNVDIPFEIRRIFYLYDIPGGKSRGAHSHIECHQMLIAMAGSFEVEIFDGINKTSVYLNQPNYGLHIPPGIWASEVNFSGGAICLVLASHEYNEGDYIRDLSEFLTSKKK